MNMIIDIFETKMTSGSGGEIFTITVTVGKEFGKAWCLLNIYLYKYEVSASLPVV